MIDPQANPPRDLRLIALATLLGAITAAVTFAFFILVEVGTALIWERAALAAGLPAPA